MSDEERAMRPLVLEPDESPVGPDRVEDRLLDGGFTLDGKIIEKMPTKGVGGKRIKFADWQEAQRLLKENPEADAPDDFKPRPAPAPTSVTEAVEALVMAKDIVNVFRWCMKKKPGRNAERDWKVLGMHFAYGMTAKEIGAKLNLHEDAVEQIIRARIAQITDELRLLQGLPVEPLKEREKLKRRRPLQRPQTAGK